MSGPISELGVVSEPGDYYLANDLIVSSVGQLTNGAALYVPAAGVRINMNGKMIRGVGLPVDVPSFGVLGESTNNLVLFDGRTGGVTGFWCGVQSATPWTRLQELLLGGNFYMGANLLAHTARLYYNLIDRIGGVTNSPYAIGLNVAASAYEIRGNTIKNIYRQGTDPSGEGCPVIVNASSGDGVCEDNWLENAEERLGTIGLFFGGGGEPLCQRNTIIGFQSGIQGGGTPESAMQALSNVITRRTPVDGAIGISCDNGLVEGNQVLNYGDTAIFGDADLGSGNTVATPAVTQAIRHG